MVGGERKEVEIEYTVLGRCRYSTYFENCGNYPGTDPLV
jgi:hypothetical protein